MQKIIAIAIGLLLLPTSPAMAQWKKDGTTVWRNGLTPGVSITAGYGGMVKTKSVKADKCKVVKIPGKKSPETGNYFTADGPIKVGSYTYSSGFDTNPGSYVYRCRKGIEGNYLPFFATPTDSTPFHHYGNNGEADLKGNMYFAPSGLTAGNTYSVEYRTFGRRKAKANTCGIAKLNTSSTYNHAAAGLSIDDDLISGLPSLVIPKCKNGVIAP